MKYHRGTKLSGLKWYLPPSKITFLCPNSSPVELFQSQILCHVSSNRAVVFKRRNRLNSSAITIIGFLLLFESSTCNRKKGDARLLSCSRYWECNNYIRNLCCNIYFLSAKFMNCDMLLLMTYKQKWYRTTGARPPSTTNLIDQK